jgi:hypothetical protein
MHNSKNLNVDNMVRIEDRWFAINYLNKSFLIVSDDDGEEIEINYNMIDEAQ